MENVSQRNLRCCFTIMWSLYSVCLFSMRSFVALTHHWLLKHSMSFNIYSKYIFLDMYILPISTISCTYVITTLSNLSRYFFIFPTFPKSKTWDIVSLKFCLFYKWEEIIICTLKQWLFCSYSFSRVTISLKKRCPFCRYSRSFSIYAADIPFPSIHPLTVDCSRNPISQANSSILPYSY